ncbi:hypothetical protein B0H10DRAFT_2208566 [Mycena sp. CBHHK59/15]|nr:hypothetical protein B0H10DRAFT_2208566 [Mycena sp. CBHHK59/15]
MAHHPISPSLASSQTHTSLSLLPSPAKAGGGVQNEFMLMPDMLHFIGTTVVGLSSPLCSSCKCAELQGKVGVLRGQCEAEAEAQFTCVREAQMQKGLHGQLECMLRRLMDKASPELSEYET